MLHDPPQKCAQHRYDCLHFFPRRIKGFGLAKKEQVCAVHVLKLKFWWCRNVFLDNVATQRDRAAWHFDIWITCGITIFFYSWAGVHSRIYWFWFCLNLIFLVLFGFVKRIKDIHCMFDILYEVLTSHHPMDGSVRQTTRLWFIFKN